MPIVVDGSNNPTNVVTRSADEIGNSNLYGVLTRNKPNASGSGDSSGSRLSLAGLLKGGFSTLGKSSTPASAIQVNTLATGSGQDWRVKVSVAKGSKVLYDAPDPGIMQELVNTNGVIFPYAPNVTINHTARYNSQPLTHSNYNNYFYEGSEVQSISISADFTVQNLNEARYFLASLYFFRAATKMFYGESKTYQGSPPPIVYLDGYGSHYLPHVSCVVTSFSHTMPNDVDYLEVALNLSTQRIATPVSNTLPGVQGGQGVLAPTPGKNEDTKSSTNYTTRVPTASTFTIALQPVYSRANQRKFDYDAFARGELIVGQSRPTGYL